MSLALAATWNPRGEFLRFSRLFPQLAEAYSGLVIVLPPGTPASLAGQIKEVSVRQPEDRPPFRLVESREWSWGRYLALQEALELPVDHVQYADLDRLLRWVETRQQEWRQVLLAILRCDCLVIGRSEAAYRSHPQALLLTEAISNQVISHLLGRAMDASAGSKGFSRRAVEFVLNNSTPGRALGTDGEWPVLAHRGGFSVDYLEVDGLDWESADRYQDQAADPGDQRKLAEDYDADPVNWAQRTRVADEIVQSALEAATRKLSNMEYLYERSTDL